MLSMELNKENLVKMFSEFVEKALSVSDKEHIAVAESETSVVKSLDEMQRRALFVVLEPQNSLEDVSDLHKDYYDEVTIEKACISFNKHSMKAGLYHKFVVDNDAVQIEQSFITPTTFETEDGITIKKGSWLMWMHFPEPLDVDDKDIWDDVLSGDFCGVSVECTGKGYDLNE